MKKDPESSCSNPKTKDVVAANPMSDISTPQTKHEVFVSFRGIHMGEDIRHIFLTHLEAAFNRKNIKSSVDYKLERGKKTWPTIVTAIEESSISLIIFSKYYATSRWCLNELVHILECTEKYKRTAIPVFYRVNPADVTDEKGTYENALAELEKIYNSTMVTSWRAALNDSVGLMGIKSSDCGNDDALLIDKIVSDVLEKLNSSNNSVNSNRLVGIEKQIARVESLLNKKLEGTRFIGIWGIGGIGKSTIAEAIFNKLRFEYGGSCFLQNVREKSSKHGTVFLKEKLFSKLLDDDVKLDTPNGLPDHVERRVKHMKVLIVLDDVDDSDQLEILDGNGDWFQSGSTVIITTRNKQVLPVEDDYIHEVGALDFDEALELFNLNAFKQDHVKMMEYCELSKKVVDYAEGIPLVLKVLGNLLRGKDKKIWESQLKKLEKMPPKDVYNALKLSYDGLDPEEQKIFLDLACFIVELNLKVEYIEALLKEGENDNSVAVGLESLKDRALITFFEGNGVSMHDKIQEMAWRIVVEECREDPGRRSRLGHPDDIYRVLQNDEGTEAIKSIMVPFTAVSKLKLSPHIFAKMSRLQFLQVVSKYFQAKEMDLLPQRLQSLPTELRYLGWMYYPLESLPENFSAEKLVILDLPCSKVEKLWQGVQNLVNLKKVDLRYSDFLKELPNFSKATNLEKLNTYGCGRLTSVHPSNFSLEKLVKLNLHYCISLRKFSVTISENMIKLNLEKTGVTALAASFESQQSKPSALEYLSLNDCHYIESLPSCLNKCTKLTFLDINECRKLKTLPELPPSLEILDAGDCTSLETIVFPSGVEQFEENRKRVVFWNCFKLDKHSRVAIAVNAQINMMQFACKHLPTHDDSFGNFEAKYTFEAEYQYPGSSVPEWFVYKTTEDYIVIDHSPPNSPILGFIFCLVMGKFSWYFQYKFNITICDDEGEGTGDHAAEMSFHGSHTDHVCVMYDQGFSRFLISRARNLRRLKIKVAVGEGIDPLIESTKWLGGFGVYPILNTSPHHNLIQKMERLDLTLQSI